MACFWVLCVRMCDMVHGWRSCVCVGGGGHLAPAVHTVIVPGTCACWPHAHWLKALAPSLQDYLETKRIAFPRFYFVAPADLLDILSKGSNPQAIIRCRAGAGCLGCARCSWADSLVICNVLRPKAMSCLPSLT